VNDFEQFTLDCICVSWLGSLIVRWTATITFLLLVDSRLHTGKDNDVSRYIILVSYAVNTYTLFNRNAIHIYILDTSLQLCSLRNLLLFPLLPFVFSAAAAFTANSRHERAFIGISTGDNGARWFSSLR